MKTIGILVLIISMLIAITSIVLIFLDKETTINVQPIPQEVIKGTLDSSPAETIFNNYIIDGNSVYWNDANIYAVAYPHTITKDSSVYFNLTSKIYEGNADLTFGFDTNKVKPQNVYIYNPRYINYTHSYYCGYNFNYTISPKHFWCYKANNITGLTEVVYDGTFEWGDIPGKIAYWNISRYEEWQKINKAFDKLDYSYGGMNTWYYIKDFPMTANHEYALKIDLRLNRINGFSYDAIDTKYWIAFKPSGETIQQAITNEHLYALDPWINSSGYGFNYTSLEENLTGWWKFDNNTGGFIEPALSMTEHIYGVNNITMATQYGFVNNAVIGTSVEINNSAESSFLQTETLTKITDNPFSISVWVNTDTVENVDHTIIDITASRLFILEHKNGVIRYIGTGGVWRDTGIGLTADTWSHLVVTFNGTTFLVYQNGTLKHTRVEGCTANSALRNTLGSQFDYSLDWDGTIDELGIWNNRTLNASEVAILYNNGLGIQWNKTATLPSPPTSPNDVNVTLYIPIDGYVSNKSNVSFLCTANSTSNGIVNLTLIINDTDILTITNSSAGQNLTLNYSYIFNDGNDNYTCRGASNINNSQVALRTFQVDTVFPSMNITFPQNTTYTTNVTVLNYTYNEANPGFCWMQYNGDCYQEFANVSTSCGGLDTGLYVNQPGNSWDAQSNLYDGDWSTGAQGDVFGVVGLFINYTKPANASQAIWEIKDTGSIVNLTIPSDCFSSTIELLITTVAGGVGNVGWWCINSSDKNSYIALRVNMLTPPVAYEEAMIWNINSTINTQSIPMGTNFTGIINSTQGNNFWNLTCNDTANNINSTSVSFFVDSIKPVITITRPENKSYNSVQTNLSYDAVDVNLASCWYTTDSGVTNITATCGNNITIAPAEAVNIWRVYANDTFGNIGNASVSFSFEMNETAAYVNPAIEGDTYSFNLTINSTSIETLNSTFTYNNTVYYPTITVNEGIGFINYSLSAPSITANAVISFFWNYTLDGVNFSTEIYNHTVYYITPATLGTSCGSGMSAALCFNTADENNRTFINESTVSYNIKYGVGNSTYKTLNSTLWLNDSSEFCICINSTVYNNYTIGYGEIQYSHAGYAQRRFYLFSTERLTNITVNNTIYLLTSGDATSFLFEMKDTSLTPYTGKYTTLLRWYPEIDQYKVVEMGRTDENGQTIMRVKVEDVDYRVGLYYTNGSLIKLADPVKMACLVDPCTYSLSVTTGLGEWFNIYDLEQSLTFNSTTKTFTYAWNDPTQETTSMRLFVVKETGLQDIMICNSSATGFTGVMTCNIGNYTGTLRARAYRSSSPEIAIAQLYAELRSGLNNFTGLFMAFVLGTVGALIGYFSPIGAIIFMVVALIPSVILGSIPFSVIMIIAVLGGIAIHVIKRN